MKSISYVGVIAIVLGISYGLWVLGKKANYSFQYESMVKETIKETVKQECLR
jgi:hypothetical protein